MNKEEAYKQTKYSYRGPINLDTISCDDYELALMEFAEGSLNLENCLRLMWQMNLKTHACCAGNHHPYDVAYIAMEKGIDIFCFLSTTLLNEDMVQLDSINNMQLFHLLPMIRNIVKY